MTRCIGQPNSFTPFLDQFISIGFARQNIRYCNFPSFSRKLNIGKMLFVIGKQAMCLLYLPACIILFNQQVQPD